MSPFITKVLTVSSLIGGFGGIIYASTYYLNGYTLGEKLEDKGHQLLNYKTNDNSDKATWTDIVKAYSNNGAKLNGKEIKLTGTEPTDSEINELKKLCSDSTSSKEYSSETGLLTEQYCVKPVNVKELLRKEKSGRILDWKPESKDDRLWDAKVSIYSTLSSEEQLKTPTKLEFTVGETSESKRNKLKKWCQEFEGNKTYEKDYHERYNDFFKWCVV